MLNRLTHQGDTIVEVIFVLAILGLALTVSYATANASLTNVRAAEEHSEATVISQTQVSDLYQLASSANSQIFTESGSFCILNDTTIDPTPSDCTFGDGKLFQTLVYSCNYYSGAGTFCEGIPGSGAGSSYKSDTFVVNTTWPSATGNGNDSVTLTYRVHS